MLKIYGFDISTPSNKVRMCANALGLDYEYIRVNLPEGEHKSEEHLARHPAGKVPAIDDDGFTLFESDAINRYLCRKHGSALYPNDLQQQAKVDQWCGFVSVHIYNALGRVFFNKLIAPRFGWEVDTRSLEDGERFLAQFLPVVDGQLQKSRFLAGEDMTIADLCLLALIDPAETIDLDLAPYPKLSAWRKDLSGQAFYRKVHDSYADAMKAAA